MALFYTDCLVLSCTDLSKEKQGWFQAFEGKEVVRTAEWDCPFPSAAERFFHYLVASRVAFEEYKDDSKLLIERIGGGHLFCEDLALPVNTEPVFFLRVHSESAPAILKGLGSNPVVRWANGELPLRINIAPAIIANTH